MDLAGCSVQGKTGWFGVTSTVRQLESKTGRTSVCRNRSVVTKICHGYRGTALSITAIP